ncbi:hypothetical protein PWT90_09651 [Aphanocladium album]|nr:hypothetical protein PWT90_09651 [Aphanocladium album]
MVRVMYLTWLLPLLALEAVAQSSLCSTVNTADSGPKPNIYESRSACSDQCNGQSAYAVVQDNQCWCSNKTPSSTTDDSDCNTPCPGYPMEMCGGDSQFSYILLDKSKVIAASPSGSSSQAPETSGPSESASTSEQPPPPQVIKVTQSNAGQSTAIIQTVQASASVQTIISSDGPASFRTVTVTVAPVTATAAASDTNPTLAASSPKPDSSSGLKRGAIAGIAVGGSAAGLCLGLAAFMIWRRSKHSRADRKGRGRENGAFGVGGGDSVTYFGSSASTIRRDNTSASADSRMGAFGQNKTLWRNSTGSLEDSSSDTNQVLWVVNPDVPEKL